MSDIKLFSSSLRDLAHVPRWAILRKNRTQSVAEHSYYVSVYALHVAEVIRWNGNRADLVTYALYHDLDETISGDIPGPYKRSAVDKKVANDATQRVMDEKFGSSVTHIVRMMSADVKAIVSVADTIDELCYLIEETRSGNTWVGPVMREVQVRLKNRWMALPAGDAFLKKLWRDNEHEWFWNCQFEGPVLLEDKV